mmetsp:Transcript_22543/g.56014  ORF Transcript_22543/g.56014 Transcript_22543/m.56014 type:complete len:116 (+) Transcript_22543:103-450(+)
MYAPKTIHFSSLIMQPKVPFLKLHSVGFLTSSQNIIEEPMCLTSVAADATAKRRTTRRVYAMTASIMLSSRLTNCVLIPLFSSPCRAAPVESTPRQHYRETRTQDEENRRTEHLR